MLKRKLSVRIKIQEAGTDLIDFLCNRYTYRSRAEWDLELQAGRLRLNQEPAGRGSLLSAGDQLVYLLPEIEEPAVARDFTVLYEDEDLLAANKPAPLPCHPGGRFFNNTLWGLLREKHDLDRPHIINRLDRETSGIVLIAKNKQAARSCSRQFEEQRVAKGYLVLVEGLFSKNEIIARGWLEPDEKSLIRKKLRFRTRSTGSPLAAGVKECVTRFRMLQKDQETSLLEARPLTGRLHQIRATLLALGYPVVGDKLYGLDEEFFLRFQNDELTGADWQRLRLNRQALHAASLSLTHPTTGKRLEFSAPLPAELRPTK